MVGAWRAQELTCLKGQVRVTVYQCFTNSSRKVVFSVMMAVLES